MDPKDLTEIAEKLRDGKLILFVGSGMSAPYFPTWSGLLSELQAASFNADPAGAAEVAQMIEEKQFLNAAWAIQHKTGSRWRNYVRDKFKGNLESSPEKDAVERKYARLKGLPFASVVTTNYDDFLVQALGTSPITHVDKDQILAMPSQFELLKLHGDATKPDTLILTATDFSVMKLDRGAIDEFMHSAAKHYSFLFLGYSFEDEDLLWWLERACYRAQGNVQGHFGLVDGHKWGSYKRELYKQRYGIRMVDAPLDSGGKYPDIEAFLGELHSAYSRAKAAPVAELFKHPLEWPESAEYVNPEIKARKDKSLHSLDAFLIDWLKSEDGSRRFLVLLGEFGTGKTQFSYRAEQLVRLHCSDRRPVLVKLGQFHKGATAKEIAASVAASNEARFLASNRDGALVLILDAFDEMGKADPKQALNESFERLTSGLLDRNCKIILTCRKEFFRDEKEEDHIPADKIIAASAEKVEVQLFDDKRIEIALARRNHAEVYDQIRDNPRVIDLARRPVLLDLIAQYNKPFDSTTKLAELYEKYIDKMLDRGPDDKHALQRREFAEKIAWRMQNSGPMPAAELEKPLKEMGFEADADRFRSRSLLVRQVDDYVFGHQSFREYLVARQVVPYLEQGKFLECKLTDATIQFVREMWQWHPPEVKHGTGEHRGMVWIPAGPFIYGEADSARLANLDQGFWMDRYPVTNEQYIEFLRSRKPKGSLFRLKKVDSKWIDFERSRITKDLSLSDLKYNDHPVVGVSWFGAQAYAEWAGKRLLSEMEWEKAARGLDGRVYPWGDLFDDRNANTRPSGPKDTTPIATYETGRSPYGAADMAGNVWEWTASDYDPSSKYLRGGSWGDYPEDARCAIRGRDDPEDTSSSFGFRCART